MTTYKTSQTSTDSTIDVYWALTNKRYMDIHAKHSFAYDAEWINGCIEYAEYGIIHCDIKLQYPRNADTVDLINRYKSSFSFIIKKLNLIKQGLIK